MPCLVSVEAESRCVLLVRDVVPCITGVTKKSHEFTEKSPDSGFDSHQTDPSITFDDSNTWANRENEGMLSFKETNRTIRFQGKFAPSVVPRADRNATDGVNCFVYHFFRCPDHVPGLSVTRKQRELVHSYGLPAACRKLDCECST